MTFDQSLEDDMVFPRKGSRQVRGEVEREARSTVYVAEILDSLIVQVHPSISQFSCSWNDVCD